MPDPLASTMIGGFPGFPDRGSSVNFTARRVDIAQPKLLLCVFDDTILAPSG